MKLICGAIHVSLLLQLIHCACLAHIIGKAEPNHGALEAFINGVAPPSLPWSEGNCCHLPKDKQDCSCCPNACAQQHQGLLSILPRTCCHLPKLLQNCQCCPKSCLPLPSTPQRSCCHLPRRFISCRCCAAACLPAPLLPDVAALTLPSLPSLPQLPQPAPTSQPPEPQFPFSCCHLPVPFQNCQCCPNVCPQPPPTAFNESCCHWPKALQNCDCCASSCNGSLADKDIVTDNPKNVSTVDEGETKPEGITEVTTETTPSSTIKIMKASNDCCHFPLELQNCSCCPSLCQETTVEPTTPSSDTCCNQPKELQNCICCSTASKKDDANEISPSTLITVTMTTNLPLPQTDVRCCHLPREFRTCECCPEKCGTPTDLLQYGNCCHWPKLLQRCECCSDACIDLASTSETIDVVEDCCDEPPELQDCQCCPTSRYCTVAIAQRWSAPYTSVWNARPFDSDTTYENTYDVDKDITPRYTPWGFEHRPETYFIRVKKRGSLISPGHRRISNPRQKPPCCLNGNSNYDFSSLNPLDMQQKSYVEDYPFEDLSSRPIRKTPAFYDYYYSRPKYRKHNKVADALLPPHIPFIRKNAVAYRTLMDLFHIEPLGINYYSAGGNSLDVGDNNEEVYTVAVEDLGDVLTQTYDSNLNDIPLESDSSSTGNRLPRSQPVGIPKLLKNLMRASKKYIKKRAKSRKHAIKNWQFKTKLSLFRDQLPYLSTLPLYPKRPINVLLLDDDQFTHRYTRYTPLHLAAPGKTVKKLITRIATGYDPITTDNSEQQLSNAYQEEAYRVMPSLAHDDFYDFGYLGDDDKAVDREDADDDYVAVVGNGGVQVIPLKYSQRPFLSSAETEEYAFQPWNVSNDNDYNEIDETPNINQGHSTSVDPYESYRASDLYSFLKFYSPPRKHLHNSNIIDGLSKVATGFEVNHGDVEFEPDVDYSGRLLLYSDQPSSQIDNDDKATDTSESMIDKDVLDMAPWLSKYGVVNSKNQFRKSESSFIYPSSSVRMAVIDPDEVQQDEDGAARWYNADAQVEPAPLPGWTFWPADESDINAIGSRFHEDENVGITYLLPIGDEDPTSPGGFRLDYQSLLPVSEVNVEMERARPKRTTKHRKLNSFWLKFYHLLNLLRMNNPNQPVIANNRRGSISQQDVILEQLFHTLRSLVPVRSSKNVHIVSRSAPSNEIPLSKLSNLLLRQIQPESSRIDKSEDSPALDELSSGLNAWPIAYGVGEAKALDLPKPTPAPSKKKVHKAASPLKHSSPKRKEKFTLPKGSTLNKVKNKKTKDKIVPVPVVVLLSHYAPIAAAPIESYLRFTNYPGDYRLYIQDDSMCQVPETELADTLPVDGVNIPTYSDEYDQEKTFGQLGLLYRTSAENAEDDFADIDANKESLEPDTLYRTGKMGEGGGHYDAKKTIFQVLGSSRMARNSAQEHESKKTAMGEEDLAQLANIENVEDPKARVLSETSTDGGEVSTTGDVSSGS